MLSQKNQEAIMLSHAVSGKFGKNVELTVSDEGKEEFGKLADILIPSRGSASIKIHTNNINLKNIENGNKKSD